MSVIISRNISLGGGGVVDTSDNPRILVENVFTLSTANVTASEEVGASNGWLENAVDGLTFDYWQVTTYPAWLEVTLTEARPVDMCAIGLHSGLDYVFQYWDGSAWVNLHDAVTATTTAVEAVIFDEVTATKFRIYITGAVGDKTLGICMLGKSLQLPKRFYGGHGPITLNRTTQVIRNTTEGGYDAGVYHLRTGAATSVEVTNMQPAWIRENIETLNRQLERQPFVFAWRPTTFPDDVAYCWLDAPIRATNSGPKDLMSLQFDFHAFVGGSAIALDPVYFAIAYAADPKLAMYAKIGDEYVEIYEASGQNGVPVAMAFDQSGIVAVTSSGGTAEDRLQVYIATESEFTEITQPSVGTAPSSVSFTPNAQHMAVSDSVSNVTRIFKRQTVDGEQYWQLKQSITGTISRFSAAGDYIAVRASLATYVDVYTFDEDTSTATSDQSLLVGQFPVSIAWSPDGGLMAVLFSSDNPRLKVYNTSTWSTITIPAVWPRAVSTTPDSLAFSPNGTYLAIGGSSTTPYLMIYKYDGSVMTDITDNIDAQPLEANGNVVAWSLDSNQLIVGSSGTAYSYFIYTRNGDNFTRSATTLSPGGAAGSAAFARFNGTITNVTPDDSTVELDLYDSGGSEVNPASDITTAGIYTIRPAIYNTAGVSTSNVEFFSGNASIGNANANPFEYDIELDSNDTGSLYLDVIVTDSIAREWTDDETYTVDISAAPDPADNTMEIASPATLSDGDLRVNMPANDAAAGRSVAQLSGKRYLEWYPTGIGVMIGVSNEQTPFTWVTGASDANSAYYFVANGNNFAKLTGGSATASGNLLGGWCGMAVDVPNKKLWLRDNSGTWWSGDPVAGTGGWAFSALDGLEVRVACGQGSGFVVADVLFNFGATAFSHSVPTGYNT